MPINTHGGGANTNSNGLAFEQDTSLETALETAGYILTEHRIQKRDGTIDLLYNGKAVRDINDNVLGYSIPKRSMYRYFNLNENNGWKQYISKILLPDDCFYNLANETIYIIEKKWQSVNGSVDEKLQTCDFKCEEYKKLFTPLNINVKYIYVLNDFFNQPKYDDVRNYIISKDCEYYYYFFNFKVIGL